MISARRKQTAQPLYRVTFPNSFVKQFLEKRFLFRGKCYFFKQNLYTLTEIFSSPPQLVKKASQSLAA